MKRLVVKLSVLSLVAIGASVAWSMWGARSASGGGEGRSCSVTSCESDAKTASAARPAGKVLGNFDRSVSGVCQAACATRGVDAATAVDPQPGARVEKLTQCPVSGVVFKVDARRPQVPVGRDVYVTCCDGCAGKLRREPGRFVRV